MVTIFTLAKEKISDWPKSGPVETGPTGPVATPLNHSKQSQRTGKMACRKVVQNIIMLHVIPELHQTTPWINVLGRNMLRLH